MKLRHLLPALVLLAACSGEPLDPMVAVFTPLQYEGTPTASYDPATQYRNPVLPGFYPDPSICRVGDDYYMVNSTFGYYPGIPVWHSTDLVHWEQLGNALTRNSQMPIRNSSIVMGVFAPQISYNPHNGLFYIINTIVGGHMNFFVTTDDPASGVWSEPTRLPAVTGIDPSILFEPDGKAWIVSTATPENFGEERLYEADNYIALLEFDWKSGKTVGERIPIARHGVNPSSEPASLEGPHLYHIGDKYFLMAAEGGTEQGHSEVLFEAPAVTGPYTPCAINPILTQRDLPIDRVPFVNCTGHADLVQTAAGNWWAVFLGVEPYEGDYYFNVGRQTFMLPVTWVDGQPVILPQGQSVPTAVDMDEEMLRLAAENKIVGFDGYKPGPLWDKDGIKDFVQFIRRPMRSTAGQGRVEEEDFDFLASRCSGPWWTVNAKGQLSLSLKAIDITGGGNPAFVGERITAKTFSAQTKMTFTPTWAEDGSRSATRAGLALYQSDTQLMTFVKTLDEDGRPVLRLAQVRGGKEERCYTEPLTSAKPVTLRVEAVTPTEYVFSYSLDGKKFTKVGESLDGKVLSTLEAGGFQGAMVGVYGARP